jgi:hypothetical protein
MAGSCGVCWTWQRLLPRLQNVMAHTLMAMPVWPSVFPVLSVHLHHWLLN